MNKAKFGLDFKVILALVLSFVGGFLECYSLTNHGFFALMQTGNLISVFMNLVRSDFTSLLVSLSSILAFIVGLICANVIEKLSRKYNKNFQIIDLILIIIFLLVNIFIPIKYTFELEILSVSKLRVESVVGNVFLAFVGAILLESFTSLHSHKYTSTMMTANLERMVKSFFRSKEEKEELTYGFEYIFIILSFALGVVSFYLYFYFLQDSFNNLNSYGEMILPNLILIIPISFLLISLTMLIIKSRKSKKEVKL